MIQLKLALDVQVNTTILSWLSPVDRGYERLMKSLCHPRQLLQQASSWCLAKVTGYAITAMAMWSKALDAKVMSLYQGGKNPAENPSSGFYDPVQVRAISYPDCSEAFTFLNDVLSNSSSNTTFCKSDKFGSLMANALTVAFSESADPAVVAQQQDKVSMIVPGAWRISAWLGKGGRAAKIQTERRRLLIGYVGPKAGNRAG